MHAASGAPPVVHRTAGRLFTGARVDAWVRPATCGTTLTSIVDKLDQNANSGFSGFSFYLASAGGTNAALKLQVNGSTSTSTSLVTANANPMQNTGTWSHIAASFVCAVRSRMRSRPSGNEPAAAVFVNGGMPTSVVRWTSGWAYNPTLAAGAPCSIIDLAAGQQTATTIQANGNYRKCM